LPHSRRSDINFKYNIADFGDAINIVNNIGVYTYNYKPNANLPQNQQIGFIAQELQPILPQVVGRDELGLNVDYVMVVPVLVKAIQQQQELIEKLESRIKLLEN
jgi:hypothetical protein